MRHTGTQTIATERLTLRRFTIEDAENMYYNWACDPEVTKYLTWQPHKSVEETTEILQQWEAGYSKNEFYQWAIELNDIEQPIGSISVVSLNEDVQSAELGYCIGKSGGIRVTPQRLWRQSSDFCWQKSVQDVSGHSMMWQIQIPAE